MPLYVAQHHHRPEDCATAPDHGGQLLSQLSAANAARHGVTIEAEAFIDGEHRLVLIVEAKGCDAVRTFLDFLLGYGELEILPASTAEEAMAHRW
jgi:hypothetical protein